MVGELTREATPERNKYAFGNAIPDRVTDELQEGEMDRRIKNAKAKQKILSQ